MSVVEIKSPGNLTLRTMRLVASQARRAPADLALAEGIRVLEEAHRSGREILCAVVAEDFGGNSRESDLQAALERSGIRVCRTTDRLLRSISTVVEPQRAVGLVRVPPLALGGVSLAPDPLVVCLCGLQDPGNLGSLLRTARAAGAAMAVTTRSTVSARNPKAVRASAGAFFALPVVESACPADVLAFCRRRAIQLLRADARGGEAYFNADLRVATALLLGSEAHGFPETDWQGVRSVRIPMAAEVESLNVATAGGVLLFEARRQRQAGSQDQDAPSSGAVP